MFSIYLLVFILIGAILNRLRGTIGAYSKFVGMILSYLVFALYDNHYVALGVGILYVIGECFKWGIQLGDLTDNGHDDIGNSREKLFIRGLIWSIFFLPLMYYIPFYYVLLACISFAGAFVLSCHLGYLSAKLFTCKYLKNSWEHQEVFTGAFMGGILYLLLNL